MTARWRGPGAALALALTLGVAPVAAAPIDEVLVPLDQYTTTKARTLATTYRGDLVKLYEHLYHCMPWVDVQKHGIGFRKPRWAAGDERYLSVWIWIEQSEDRGFAALGQGQRASAMFSRYGVALLRRLSGLGGVAGDPTLDGFGIILSWIKPGTHARPGVQPVNETLALFVDRASVAEYLARRLSGPAFAERARFTVFDGQDDRGRLPLDVWDDPFLETFRPRNYQPPPGQSC